MTGQAADLRPPRIASLKLGDFRAFAGQSNDPIKLNGKNLLVYGENGAGKSSIFYALDGFFAMPSKLKGPHTRQKQLADHANKFTQKVKCKVIRDFWDERAVRQAAGSDIEIPVYLAQNALETGALQAISMSNDAFVEVQFEGVDTVIRWDSAGHPVDVLTGANKLTENAARKKSILDYRSLLETNFRHGQSKINLFHVIVEVLLRDYEIVHAGSPWQLIDLWHELQSMLDVKQIRDRERTAIYALTTSFNTGLDAALQLLTPKIEPILRELGWDDVKIAGFNFSRISYNNAKAASARGFDGLEIVPSIAFLGYRPETPQLFLNEARQSALALAIYLAGRELCAHTIQANTPWLMVLDDVLIGLDHSNRLPVLQVLVTRFSKWQIVLLTHDKVWFDMARGHLRPAKEWACLEIYEGKEPSGVSRPVLKPQNFGVVDGNIVKARSFHANHEYAAAAVHARIAVETILKSVCEENDVPVKYKSEPRKLSLEDLLGAFETWLSKPNNVTKKASVDPAVATVKMFRTVVLNPFSHSTPITLAANEILGAIDAVDALKSAIQTHIK